MLNKYFFEWTIQNLSLKQKSHSYRFYNDQSTMFLGRKFYSTYLKNIWETLCTDKNSAYRIAQYMERKDIFYYN